jgi:hypothetical protein
MWQVQSLTVKWLAIPGEIGSCANV